MNTDHWERDIDCMSLFFVWRQRFPTPCGMHLCSKISPKLHPEFQLYVGDPLHLRTSLCCSQNISFVWRSKWYPPKVQHGNLKLAAWNRRLFLETIIFFRGFLMLNFVGVHIFLQGTRLESDHWFLDSAEVGRAFGLCQSGANRRWALKRVTAWFLLRISYTPGSTTVT